MYNKTLRLIIFFVSLIMGELSYAQDWADLNRYKSSNEILGRASAGENRIIFMGNSITEGWMQADPEFFKGKSYINRAIGGQTTPQMLLRFRADVVDLHPKVVVILAGTNDIAGNTGPSTLKMIADNIFSMAEIAKINGIKVVISSVLPVYDYPWRPGLKPAEKIVTLNAMLKEYADKNMMIYLDYFNVMVDKKNGLKKEFAPDGVHPNLAGYKVMEPLVEEAIDKALNY